MSGFSKISFNQKITRRNQTYHNHKYAHPKAVICNKLSNKFDIYSLGIIILELFTGKPAFGKPNKNELHDIYSMILKNPLKVNAINYHD
jgi:serine/threonine protein kinase